MFFLLLPAITHLGADDGDSYGCWFHHIHSVIPSPYTKEMLNKCLLDEEGVPVCPHFQISFCPGVEEFFFLAWLKAEYE